MSDEAIITLRFVGDPKNAKAAADAVAESLDRLGNKGQSAGQDTAAAHAKAQAAISRTNTEIQKLIQNSARMAQVGAQAGERIARGARQSEMALQALYSVAREIRATLAVLAGIKLAVGTVTAIVEQADAYQNLNSRLRTITETETELIRVRNQAFDIAQRTRTEFDATVNLYARLTRATENLRLSEQKRLAITETITKAYTLSGATVQEATNSIIQLTQGLAAGALRGEEFNSVAEQGPIILELLSKSLGKTRGELRAFAKEGGLTAEVVIEALQSGQREIDDQFSQVSVTIAGAAQRVANAWEVWIGQTAEISGASRNIADALTYVSQNMDDIATLGLDVAQVLGTIFIGRTLQSLIAYTAAKAHHVQVTINETAAVRANALQILAETQAEVAAIQATKAAASAALDKELAVHKSLVAERELQASIVASAEAQVAQQQAIMRSALAHVAAADGVGAYSFALREAAIAEAQLTEATSVLAAAETRLEVATGAVIAAENARVVSAERLVALTAAETEAIVALTGAQTALTAASSTAARAQTAMGAALGALHAGAGRVLQLIGGWPTVVLAAAYATWQWVQSSEDSQKAFDSLERAVESLRERNESYARSLRNQGDEMTANAMQIDDLAEKTINLTLQEMEGIQATQDYYLSWHQLTGSLGASAIAAAGYQIKMIALRGDLEEATKKQKEFNEQLREWRRLTRFEDVKAGVDSTANVGMLDGKAVVKLENEIDRQNIRLRENKIANEQGTLAAMKFRVEQELGKGAFERLSPSMREMIEENARLTDEQKAATAAKKDYNRELKEEARELRDAQSIWESNTEMIARIADEYSGPLAKANKDWRKQQQDLNDGLAAAQVLLDAGKISAAEYAIREQEIATALQQSNEQNAIKVALIEEAENFSALAIKALDEEYDLIKLSVRERKAEVEVMKVQQQYHQRGKDLTDAEVASLRNEIQARQDRNRELEESLRLQREIEEYSDFRRIDDKGVGSIQDIVSQFTEVDGITKIVRQIEKMQKALEEVSDPLKEAFDPKLVKDFETAIKGLNDQLAIKTLGSYKALLGAVQTFTEEGSSAFKAIEVGMAALQIVQDLIAMRAAVIAVLTQGEGEPYSAWARMAAMAAAVAPFLASIGMTLASFAGGGGEDMTAENRQARQGTGTVLGDAEAKSESIANAIEITAEATSELVGLNRGMLNALLNLERALGAAGNMLARGAGEAEFGSLNDTTYGLMGPVGRFNPLLNAMTGAYDPIGQAIGGWLWGGDQEIVDQGIIIAGGTLNDMINKIMVGAYQTIETSGGLFGSDKQRDELGAVSEQFSRQFQLVIGSVVDTVREGALALGLLPAEIEAAIEAFRVEEIRISLEGLSAEEQQAELEAVFSSIFDGLAGSVVPFIEQFQQVGEGLGETLVRVATGVLVTHEAIRQLGLTVNETDPEKFAQISEGLIQAVGSIDEFISQLNSFVSAFAPASYQASVNTDALVTAFEEVDLVLPSTRAGMWELMQSLDATTEAGRAQIATLLRLAEASDEYYTALDEATEFLEGIGLYGGGLTAFEEELAGILESGERAITAANMVAVAHGRAGASAREMAQIYDWVAQETAAAIARLRDSAQSLAFNLGLSDTPGSEDIEAEIARLEALSQNASASVRQFGDAMRTAAQSATDAINLLLGNLSPLNDFEKLEIARSGLMRGTVSQEDFLQIARRLFASTRQYEAEFAFAQQYPGRGNVSGQVGNSGVQQQVMTAADSQRLQELYELRDSIQGQQDYLNAQELASQIADISAASGDSIIDVINGLGINTDERLQDFAEKLHLDNQAELLEYIEAYQTQLDADGRNTLTLVAAIDRLGDRLLGVTPTEEAPVTRDDRMVAGGSRIRLDREDMDYLADQVSTRTGRVLLPEMVGSRPRSNRPPTRD